MSQLDLLAEEIERVCNDGLGGFRDDLTTVMNAVRYLQNHKEKIKNETNT
jgi:hypothetical protein